MPNNYLSVLYKHIIQVENKSVGLKGGGGGAQTYHCPPPRCLRQYIMYLYVKKACVLNTFDLRLISSKGYFINTPYHRQDSICYSLYGSFPHRNQALPLNGSCNCYEYSQNVKKPSKPPQTNNHPPKKIKK